MKPSNSIICTVFEGHYHKGVVALANSLYDKEFRGTLYAAFRGELPEWALAGDRVSDHETVLEVADGFRIQFVRLQTDEMLANVKPELIQKVWREYQDQVDNIFYIDCDIVIKSNWHHFETWAELGVTLVEDINSPMPASHPVRLKWKRYYAQHGIDYRPKDDYYVNGGFVGLNREHIGFAETWRVVQEKMKLYTGSSDRIGIANRWHLFHFMDQDALNVAKDLSDNISVMNKHAMDFQWFGYVMSHAAGREKPWQVSFIPKIFKEGHKPTFTEKIYWENVSSPIRLYDESYTRRKRLALRIALFIGRFYTRT